MKFTETEKFEAVQQYLKGNASYRGIAEQIGIDHKSVRKWVGLYRAHGMEGLRLRSSCTNYSVAFKLDVLKDMMETGASLLATAVKHNISSPQTVLRWKRQLMDRPETLLSFEKEESAVKRDQRKNSGQKEALETALAAAEAENERLRMELAYSKKLRALAQKKESSPTKNGRKPSSS